jgi:tetratricopeptide (TPR) repeat protein
VACARVDLERAELFVRRKDPADTAQALSLCDDALACIEQLDDPLARADALMTRADVLSNADRVREAIVEAEKARQIYEEREKTHSLSNVCRFMAEVHVHRARIPEAAMFAADAIKGYERVGDSVGKAGALRVRARTWQARGQRPRALQDCQEAVRLLDAACMRAAQGRVMLLLAELENDAGRFDEGQRALEAAVEYLRESPERVAFVLALLRLADTLRRRNAIEAAAARLDDAEACCGIAATPAGGADVHDVMRERDRLTLMLEICRIAKQMPTPDKPRIRRVSAAAIEVARALANADADASARAYAAYAR